MAKSNKPHRTERKPVSPDAPRYRLKDGAPDHYINGRIVRAGTPAAQSFTLPEGVEPGDWLEKVSGAKAKPADEKTDEKKA